MKRLPSGRMFDLLPAGHSRRHKHRVRLTFDGGKEPSAANCHRDVIVLFLKTEGSSHATATGIDFFDGVRQGYGLLQETGADKRLFVTVPMNQRLHVLSLE